MIPDDRTESMEPPECNADDVRVECDCCHNEAVDGDSLCRECREEADSINGISDETP